MKELSIRREGLSLFLLLFLTGCGGGGSSSSTETIQAVDGYIAKGQALNLTIKGNEYPCKVGEEGQLSCDKVKGKGAFALKAQGLKIDSNNDGQLDDSDVELEFDMSAPEDSKVITPLTTLLVKMEVAGKEVSDELRKLILNFDPVKAPTEMLGGDANADNMLILTEVVKAGLHLDAPGLEDMDLSSILSSGEVDIDKLVQSFSDKTYRDEITNKATEVKNVLKLLSDFDAKAKIDEKIDVNTLLVAMSDGGKVLKEALILAANDKEVSLTDSMTEEGMLATLAGDTTPPSTPPSTIPNTTPSTTPSTTPVGGGYVGGGSGTPTLPPAKADLSDAKMTMGGLDVELNDENEFNTTVAPNNTVEDFYDINLSSISVDKVFDWTPATLTFTIKDEPNSKIFKAVITGAYIRSEDKVSIETKLPVGTTLKTTTTTDTTENERSVDTNKEIINTDMVLNIGDVLDSVEGDQAKIDDTKADLQYYLDNSGTYQFSMHVDCANFEITPDITGDVTVN